MVKHNYNYSLCTVGSYYQYRSLTLLTDFTSHHGKISYTIYFAGLDFDITAVLKTGDSLDTMPARMPAVTTGGPLPRSAPCASAARA